MLTILKDRIDAALKRIEGPTKLPRAIHAMDGMSTPKIREIMNELCNFKGCNYLEVGTWKGATFCSAIHNNPIRTTVIDNWSEFTDMTINHQQEGMAEEVFFRNVTTAYSWQSPENRAEVQILKGDSFSNGVLGQLKFAPYNVYFYDGNHAEDSHYKAYTVYNQFLSNPFLTVIDDYKGPQIKDLTQRAFKDLNYKVIKAVELDDGKETWESDWWNGLFIGVIKKC